MTKFRFQERSSAPGPAGVRVRTGATAGSYGSCMTYCDQERFRCLADPAMPQGACDDRYPVCQNACTVCASTY